MQELNNAKSDAAIMGRVAAFQHGIKMYDTKWKGVGYGRYVPTFIEANGYRKASHSSFVQMGTELGFPGFLLFWGLVYCCLRTLLTALPQSVDEERVRRLLFVLLFAYLVSSWMVDLGYRPTFFLFAGAIAAFHRYLLGLNEDVVADTAKGVNFANSRRTRMDGALSSAPPRIKRSAGCSRERRRGARCRCAGGS
jgi:O-antigen ligase